MLMLVMLLIVSGRRRVRHLGYLASDPVVLRGRGLKRLPSLRTVERWLGAFDALARQGLMRLNDELVSAVIRAAGVQRLTVDVDGSVVSTGLQVEGDL